MYPKKILLAEDDVDDRMFFSEFLQSRSDVVLLPAVENGVELFQYLENTADQTALPDAIILDQNMPKQNGLQTLQLLKGTSKYAHIPVMVYSTYADESLVKNSTASGAALVFPKPVTVEGYHKMIDTFFSVLQ